MKKKIWKNYFDIVILPPKDVSDYARKLSKNLSNYGTNWVLGKNSFIPHISLYHIPVKPKNFKPFVAEICRTIENFTPGYLRTTIVEPNFIMFDKPFWLNKLYLNIIKNTLKYFDREYHIEKYWHLDTFPRQMRKTGARFLKKYGTPMAGFNFKPHVTLATFKDSSPNLPIKKAKFFKFKPKYLFICELGPSHTCQRIVKKLAFRKN